jgi:acyl-coenzyme A thioesterase PaaI-like protein
MRALDVRWRRSDAEGAEFLLPWAPRVAAAPMADEVDPRAAVALLDYTGGMAIYAGVGGLATATLELRIDVVGPAPVAVGVKVVTWMGEVQRGSGLVHGYAAADAPEGQPFLRMTARYIVGSGPGLAPASSGYMAERETRLAGFADVVAGPEPSFDEVLGVLPEAEAWRMPYKPSLIGSVMLPAFHGGAVAGALMTVLEATGREAAPTLGLASMTIQYLRPARAVDIRLTARLVQGGRRAAFVEAEAWQGEMLVASARALFG